VDFRNVHLGQKAEMHLDAYPGWRCRRRSNSFRRWGTKGNSTNWYGRLRAVPCKGRTRDCWPDLSAALDLDLVWEARKGFSGCPRQSGWGSRKKKNGGVGRRGSSVVGMHLFPPISFRGARVARHSRVTPVAHDEKGVHRVSSSGAASPA